MRTPLLSLLAVAALLAGCGGSSSSPPATSQPTASALTLKWKHAPPMTIDKNRTYTADVKTDDGPFTIQLLPKVAPLAVNNFVFLARHHYFDNNIFWRVIAGFMVQTGDPTGTGLGGPGYTFNDEPVTMPYTRGIVAMANSGPNTNGSQFFVVVGQNVQLEPKYTIFGKVSSGMDVVQKIASEQVTVNPGNNELSEPVNPVKIDSVTIH